MTNNFQKTAFDEFQKSATQFASSKSATGALAKSYVRYDNLIAKAIEASPTKPACKAGCAFCCYYKVEVRAHEMLLIKEHMISTLSAERIAAVLAAARTNAATIRTLTLEQHLTTNIKCAMLQDNQCSIYSVRPFRCRNFHSIDADACEQSYGDPSNMEIATGMIEDVAMFADAHTQGFEAAAEQAGKDKRVYDFTTALLEVFEDPDTLKRYRAGKKVFRQSVEVLE